MEKAQDLQRAIYFSRDLKKITSFLEKALQAAHNVRCKLDVALDQSSLGRLIGECLETLPDDVFVMILELAIFTPTDLLHLSGVNRAFRSILHCKVSSGIWARVIWDVLAKVKRGMNQIEMLGHFLERSGEASFMALIRPGNKDFEQPLSLICREADRWSSLYVCHDS